MLSKLWLGLLLATVLISCKNRDAQSKQDLSQQIADSCAQNPVQLLEYELKSKQSLYSFGPKDLEFRQNYGALKQAFQASGRDLSGQNKQDFVNRFVPRYVLACTNFYAPAVAACQHHALGTLALSQCLEPFNQEFRLYLNKSLKTSADGRLELESLSP